MSLRPFFSFPSAFDDVFSDYLSYSPKIQNRNNEAGTLSPALDVHEGKDTVAIDVELPGVSKDNVQVHYDNGKLTVSGEVVNERKSEEEGHRWSERRFGSFSRTITVPAKVDPERIEASFSNGLLSIVLPKVDKTATTKKIDIK
ncbi:hsp16-like protein [Schizosaccharomyces japonicus yFS275]|uniref:Hsp16-like protein n=1 Tax=Schizosaccharomyces japonicus (strain yFS275 / FY16936) TaxID=402676 RepID=B6K549_SCHJY|nr:hsp16-like protein [Schizosaccharomyces japonicus yFS275]EEB08653.1 hsp16-like protein [Schizosaccharomyces japonicus yFS275]